MRSSFSTTMRSSLASTKQQKPVDPEADSSKELNALQAAFAERARNEAARKELATDSEFWCCLVFQTRDQAEAFAESLGQPGEKYLDGRPIAKRLGVSIPPDPIFNRVKIDKRLKSLVKRPDE